MVEYSGASLSLKELQDLTRNVPVTLSWSNGAGMAGLAQG